MRCGASYTIYRWQAQTMAVVSEARGRRDLPPLGACEWAPPATSVTSGVVKKEKKRALQSSTIHCCLTPLGTHPPCSCHCQMLWVAARHLVTVPSQDPTTRRSCCSTCCVGYVGQGASCVVCRWQGQTTTIIPDCRGGCGTLPLELPEQKSLAAPFT